MSACKRGITSITFTRICAVMKVRNEVRSHSETIDITDCDVTNWVPGDCSVLCDDSCPTIFGPNDDPYKCGGWQTLACEVIQKPSEHGVKCPPFTVTPKEVQPAIMPSKLQAVYVVWMV